MNQYAALKIVAGTSHPALAKGIAQQLGIPVTPMDVSKFSDGETYVRIDESIRACDVFVVQTLCNPANDYLMELFIIVDALRRASAGRITAVVPYFAYARQDRKTNDREPITAKLVANLMTTAGINRVLTADLHADQVQGFFDIPLDHIKALPLIAGYLKKKKIKDLVVVSPDFGSIKRSHELATALDTALVVISKRRSRKEHDTIEDMTILGEVKGKNIVIVDDMISTGGTIVRAVEVLKKNGAKDCYVGCTHPLLIGHAAEKLAQADIKELIVTDSVPLPHQKFLKQMVVLSLAPWLAKTIECIHQGTQMGMLFDQLKSDYLEGKR
ncbi:ribose-phosphate pyrophosphokinase [Candidatus Woesearchaeota archaeon]|nr:ribose-phosphate pyrophosphokinase [Candidatus Woesearchaeota archaeon]